MLVRRGCVGGTFHGEENLHEGGAGFPSIILKKKTMKK